jgi:peptide chain release factor 1
MEKELLFSLTKKDFIVQHFKASGPGGQKKNKTSSAVRIIHPESGARAEGKEERSQTANKRNAFERLIATEEFKNWHRIKVAEALNGKEELEKWLNKMMEPSNMKIETRDPETGKWIESKAI